MDFIENDLELIQKLSWLGNQLEGYFYTKACNEGKFEKGLYSDILATRKERLNEDIKELVMYVKKNY